MECKNNTTMLDEDCSKVNEIRIKEEQVEQSAISTESRNHQLLQDETYFEECFYRSEVDTKVGIKQETWDHSVESSNIKYDAESRTLKGDDKTDFKEEPEFCVTKSADSYNEQKQRNTEKNEASKDILHLESRLNVEASRCPLPSSTEEACKEENYYFDSKFHKNHVSANIYNLDCEKEEQDTDNGSVISVKSSLNIHQLIPEGKKITKDNIDEQQLSSTEQLTSCVEDKAHRCKICNKSFAALASLKRHKNIHDGKKSCTRKSISGLVDLKTHKVIHKDQKPQHCDICNIRFSTPGSLKRHKLIHEGIKPHKCAICDKSFSRLGDMRIHTLIHEGKKPHHCEICNKSFTQLGNLKSHKLTHEGKKPHKCDTCAKTFTLLKHLKRHKLIHEDKKPYKCDICDMDFVQRGNLKTHKLKHEGIKPHRCNICDKAFTLLPHLKTHNLIHEGVKPHKCDVCNMSFSQLGNLKTHKLTHEGKKPHKCNICEKNFTLLKQLNVHMMYHEGKKPHNCDTCGKRFTMVGDLKKHKLVHERKKAVN